MNRSTTESRHNKAIFESRQEFSKLNTMRAILGPSFPDCKSVSGSVVWNTVPNRLSNCCEALQGHRLPTVPRRPVSSWALLEVQCFVGPARSPSPTVSATIPDLNLSTNATV